MQRTMAYQAVDMQSAQMSPLLSLPAELRNHIYAYVVTGHDKIDITIEQQPGLARACTETRSESLQMYYALNVFTFAPTTRGESALGKLEEWLSRIGPKNCGFLRRVLVTLSKDTGTLINESGAASDAWSALYAHMHTTGCTSHLYLAVQLNEDMRPDKMCFDAFIRLKGSEKAAEDLVDKARETTKGMLCAYLSLLKRECFDTIALQEWMSVACPIDRLTSRARDLLCYLFEPLCGSHMKLSPVPRESPTGEVCHALEKFIEAFPHRRGFEPT